MRGPAPRWCAAVVVIAVLAMAQPAFASDTTAAPPAAMVPPVVPTPTQLPTDLGRLPCLPIVGCDPLGGLGQAAAASMARAVFTAFAGFVADGVRGVLLQVSAAIDSTTSERLDSQWFDSHAASLRDLAVLVLLPMMLVGLISAVIRRDAGQLLRAGGVYVPVAIVGGVAAVTLTVQALQVTDAATRFVTGDLHGSVDRATAALADAVQQLSTAGAPGLGTFLAIIVMLLLMAGAVLIWIELLLRTSAIYVVVLFLPLALTGLVWRATVAWTRRMIEVLVALILSKFVIVVVIDLAAGMITANDGIGTIMQGATLLLLAACAPFALLRLIPIVEAGAIGHLERMERRPLAAASRATATIARHVVPMGEAASGGKSLQDNGGDPSAILNRTREPGGQLDHLQVPASSKDGSGGPVSGGAVGGAGTTGPGTSAATGSAATRSAAIDTGSQPEPMAEVAHGD